MSLTRRLAAGLPAVGMSLFAALAFGGASASADTSSVRAAQPSVTQPACAGNARDCKTGYGADSETPGGPGAGPDTGDDTGDDTGNGAGPVTTGGHTRGNPGYGGTSPTTAPPTTPTTPTTVPTTTPTGYTDTVPPRGVSPTTVSPSPSRSGGGVSPAHTLAVTGAPSAGTVAAGVLLVAAGGFALWLGRRRRTA